jgi:broad specificity phosphatase PhoE
MATETNISSGYRRPVMGSRPTRVLIVRHGQSTWNADGRWQGRADPPLSALGEAQARAAADTLPDVDRVVASDLARARQTAEIISAARRLGPVHLDERLRERDSGDWTGFTREEIELAWPGWLDTGRLPDNFEPWERVAERVTDAVWATHDASPGGTVLVVAHGGVVRSLERSIGADGSVPKNLGGRWFDVDGDGIAAGEVVTLIDHAGVVVTAPESL